MRDLIRPDASISPQEIFARMQGAWLEPRQGSMWRENTGATPTMSGGQTIGLLLDQSQQLQFGLELVTNGTFLAGITGWDVRGNATLTRSTTYFSDGAIKIAVTTADTGATQTLSGLTVGRYYEVSADAYAPSTNTVLNGAVISLVAAPGLSDALSAQVTSEDVQQRLSIRFRATTTSYILYLYCLNRGVQWGIGGDSAHFDNISVREMLGNHAFQATAANRPTLQYNGNLPLIRHADSTDVLVAAMPDLGGGVFSTAGSVYFATPQGMSCLHNQSIGTTYNLPALQTDIYGTVITPARLSPPLEQRLAVYMHRLAGLADADFFWQELATDGMTGQLLADDNDTILLRA